MGKNISKLNTPNYRGSCMIVGGFIHICVFGLQMYELALTGVGHPRN